MSNSDMPYHAAVCRPSICIIRHSLLQHPKSNCAAVCLCVSILKGVCNLLENHPFVPYGTPDVDCRRLRDYLTSKISNAHCLVCRRIVTYYYVSSVKVHALSWDSLIPNTSCPQHPQFFSPRAKRHSVPNQVEHGGHKTRGKRFGCPREYPRVFLCDVKRDGPLEGHVHACLPSTLGLFSSSRR